MDQWLCGNKRPKGIVNSWEVFPIDVFLLFVHRSCKAEFHCMILSQRPPKYGQMEAIAESKTVKPSYCNRKVNPGTVLKTLVTRCDVPQYEFVNNGPLSSCGERQAIDGKSLLVEMDSSFSKPIPGAIVPLSRPQNTFSLYKAWQCT